MKNWTRWLPPQKRVMPVQLAPWLTEQGSLTRRLRQHNRVDFSVQLLGQYWLKPLPDEWSVLGVARTQLCFQREVRLMDGDTANVYARTVVPMTTYLAMKQRFRGLGNHSLGELLFTDPAIRRGSIEIACLQPGQWLYEQALQAESSRPEQIWGRRSLFYLGGKVLLVNELFLPTLTKEA